MKINKDTIKPLSKGKKVFKIYLIVIAIILVAVIAGLWNFQSNSKHLSVTYVEDIQELSSLVTARTYTKTVIQDEDNKIFGKNISINLPGTKREVLLIIPATVLAGVDLKEVTSDDLKINKKTKEINIKLPHADFLEEPNLQFDKVQTYVDGGLFRDNVDWNEGYKLAEKAQKQIREELISEGILDVADENAVKAIKEFLGKDGYIVNVTFK